MTDRDDRTSPPKSGMRADHDADDRTRPDAGWPRRTEEEAEGRGEEAGAALEEQPQVREAIDDDTSTGAFTDRAEEDRGPLAPEFQEPTDDGA
ncbi:hypothetical protein ABZ920_28925 [Streptomyces sp. NPDC046831]|uniref:hypothetical protein n=1 Tax=Streptomyces sp. NPDC046831 TaxID=3154805 RepID=UPI0033CAE8BB